MGSGNWGNIELCFEKRLCEVEGELGYFHCWEHFSKPIPASNLAGGHPSGFRAGVCGIVEFSNCVTRVDPYKIRFCDEENETLNEMAKNWENKSNGNC